MSERAYRFVLGAALVLLLYFDLGILIFVYIAGLLCEGISNWRIPILVSRLRYGKDFTDTHARTPGSYRFEFEAERGMRLVFASVLMVSYFILPKEFWYVNWLIGIALFLSGMVNFCPVAFSLRWFGFK